MKNKKESFRIKRTTYNRLDAYSIEGNAIIIDGDKEDVEKITLFEFPEGPEIVKGNFENFESLEAIILSSTIKTILNANLFKNSSINSIDMSKSKIENIDSGLFTDMLNIEEIKLPEAVKNIGSAFNGSGIESIYIPHTVEYVVPKAFDNCPFLQTIYTDDKQKLIYMLEESLIDKLDRLKIKIIEKEH